MGINTLENSGAKINVLTDAERQGILARADLRMRAQKLKVDMMNLGTAEQNNENSERYDKARSLVIKEADGNELMSVDEANEFLNQEADGLKDRAEEFGKCAPDLSCYIFTKIAKAQQLANGNFSESLEVAKEFSGKSNDIIKLSPSSLLPDAMFLGIQKRVIDKIELPDIKKVAQEVVGNQKLLESYALVLSEKERADFLAQLPEKEKRRVSIILDSAVSKVLHQSLIEKETPEEEQRRQVRIRLFKELKQAVDDPKTTEKNLAKMLAKSLGELGEDARQLFLELIRDEYDNRKAGEFEEVEKGYLPRVMKVMTDNFDDWRANDIILRVAGDSRLDKHLSVFLFGKLVEKNYLEKGVGEWWKKNRGKNEAKSLEILQKVSLDLGVVPSVSILEFISDDTKWKKGSKALSVSERIEKIKSSQEEFKGIKNNVELAKDLNKDENKAMMFYLLYGGQDRFNLINNYSFEKFREMIGLISGDPNYAQSKNLTPLKIHERPIEQFRKTLLNSGVDGKRAEEIIANLRGGHFFFEDSIKASQARQEVNFDTNENATLLLANESIGKVMGSGQLGVILKFPLYREYLEQSTDPKAKQFIEKLGKSTTFDDRTQLLSEMEREFPDFSKRLKDDLSDNWKKFGEKMLIELSLDQVLESPSVQVKGEELLPRLDAKRLDLKRIKKDLLVLLKTDNKALDDVNREISKKKRAKVGLLEGLEKQKDENKRLAIQKNLDSLILDIEELEKKKTMIGEAKVDERFKHLSEQDKKEEVERLSKEIMALTEKSPSAIFTYITMQVIGEERLRENDVALIRELESHLQGPFQQISDFKMYDRPKEAKKRTVIDLRFLDKRQRMMNMVRFADSKICCFSSSNYEMRVGHDTPNKFWVASINVDPMSFVISMEIPNQENADGKNEGEVVENVGFIFGSFGSTKNNKLAVLLNGIYYAPGIQDDEQTKAIMVGVEKIFNGLPVEVVAIGSQYGGALGDKLSGEFTNNSIELMRLRAVDDGGGDPESKIYDDLNTHSDLNKYHPYGKSVWHKKIKK